MPRGKSVAQAEIASHVPRLSKIQGFHVERIARADIKTVPWNPRIIGRHERKKLMSSLKKVGLVETLIWNKRSGNLVGGHQRLGIIDELEGSPDYSLDVAVVDLDDKAEKALNVQLNNAAMQGSYDAALLEDLLKTSGIPFEDFGFDRMDVEAMFAGTGSDVSTLFKEEEPEEPEAVKDDLDELEKIAALKRRRKEYVEDKNEEEDTRFMTMLVFRDNAQRERLMAHLEISANTRYVDANVLFTHLGIEDEA